MDTDLKHNHRKGIFQDVNAPMYLLGLLSAFENQYQSKADKYFQEITGTTWKQFLCLVSIQLFDQPPTLGDLAGVVKTSHQNVKQLLVKLEGRGYVTLVTDPEDRRKQRVELTQKCQTSLQAHDQEGRDMVARLFQGIDPDHILTTIKTISAMERNLDQL